MIYEATPGERIDRTALTALQSGCSRMLHNERVFRVWIAWEQEGILREHPKPLSMTDVTDAQGRRDV